MRKKEGVSCLISSQIDCWKLKNSTKTPASLCLVYILHVLFLALRVCRFFHSRKRIDARCKCIHKRVHVCVSLPGMCMGCDSFLAITHQFVLVFSFYPLTILTLLVTRCHLPTREILPEWNGMLKYFISRHSTFLFWRDKASPAFLTELLLRPRSHFNHKLYHDEFYKFRFQQDIKNFEEKWI